MENTPSAPPAGLPTRTLLMLGLLVLIGTYGIQRGNGFIYDDHLLIIDSVPLSSMQQVADFFSGTHYAGQHYYRPVTKLAYGLQKRLFGNLPAPYHAVNVALAGLVFLLFAAILRRLYPAAGNSLAVYLSLLCCLHPVTASVVYPIAGMETLLVTVFGMASLLCYLRGGPASFPLALLFAVLALLTKEQGVIVPVLLVLADLAGLRAEHATGRMKLLARWACLAGATLGYLAIRLTLFSGNEFQSATAASAGTPGQSFLYTLQVIFTPFYSLYYEPYYAVWFSPPRLALALATAGLLLSLVLWRRGRIGRSALFWAAYFLLAVLPTANLVSQETPFAERYAFAALPAVLGLLAALLSTFALDGKLKSAALSLAVLVLVVSGLTTVNRGQYYRDDLTFAGQWVRTNPLHPSARTLYGNALLRLERREEATRHLEESLRITPGDAQQTNSLGILYAADGRVEEARALFLQALQLDPGYAAARFNLIHLERLHGDPREARIALEQALLLHPGYAEEHYRLGLMYEQEANLGKSREHWQKALQIDPGHQRARQDLERTRG